MCSIENLNPCQCQQATVAHETYTHSYQEDFMTTGIALEQNSNRVPERNSDVRQQPNPDPRGPITIPYKLSHVPFDEKTRLVSRPGAPHADMDPINVTIYPGVNDPTGGALRSVIFQGRSLPSEAFLSDINPSSKLPGACLVVVIDIGQPSIPVAHYPPSIDSQHSQAEMKIELPSTPCQVGTSWSPTKSGTARISCPCHEGDNHVCQTTFTEVSHLIGHLISKHRFSKGYYDENTSRRKHKADNYIIPPPSSTHTHVLCTLCYKAYAVVTEGDPTIHYLLFCQNMQNKHTKEQKTKMIRDFVRFECSSNQINYMPTLGSEGSACDVSQPW